MISPQELQNKKFEKAMFGGYDMAGIDEFWMRSSPIIQPCTKRT